MALDRTGGMQKRVWWTIAGVSLLGCIGYGAAFAAGSGATDERARPRPGSERTPVLVELFTSEGCSSCPPADDSLARLAKEQPVDGVQIVPIAFHVDYWDSLGWADPFGSAAFTERQRGYGRVLPGGGVYTPEAVVDGRAGMVGSQETLTRRAIAEAARIPRARVDVSVGAHDGGRFTLEIKLGALPPGAATDAEVLVALTEGPMRVAVPRGENAGRTLDHPAVARALRVVGAADGRQTTLRTVLSVPPGATAPRAVVFVQEPVTRRVLGVGTIGLDG